jgi:protein O-mannosyl-transferase
MILRYLRVSFWPRSLIFDYGLPQATTLRQVLPAAVVIVVMAAGTVAAWRRSRELAFLGIWFWITLAPTSSVIPIATEVGADRRMYLPLAALVVAVVVAARALTHRRGVLAAGLLIVASLLGGLTVRRNAEYHTVLGLWQTALDRYPQGRAHYNVGVELQALHRRDEAIREFQIAAVDQPDAIYALGFELAADGKHAEAAERLREYIRLKPEDINVIRAYNLLGLQLLADEKLKEAEDAFRHALVMRPRNIDSLEGLAQALLQQERFDEAAVAYQNAIRVGPKKGLDYFGLGLALDRRGLVADAVAALTTAVELEPRDADFRVALGSGLTKIGRLQDAAEQYRRAAELERDPDVRAELSRIIAQLAAQQNTAR